MKEKRGVPRPEPGSLQKLISRFQDRLAQAAIHPEEASSIHSLRIAIRRLRISLASTDPANRRAWMLELRPIFRAAGRLRDLQVQRELIARIHPPSLAGFTAYALEKEEVALKEARHALNAFRFPEEDRSFDVMNASTTEPPVEKTHIRQWQRRFERLSAELKDFSSDWPPERIHALRISLKRVRYTLDLLDPRPRREDARELLTLWQDRLGEIQDLIVLRQASMTGGFHSHELGRAIELRKEILLRSLEQGPSLLLRKKLRRMEKGLRKKK